MNCALHLCPCLRNPNLLNKIRWETTHRIQHAKIKTVLKKLLRYLQDLSEAISGLCQVNQSLLQVTEEDKFDTFGRYLALGLKKLPLHLTVQCQNDLQATLN